MTCRSFCSLCLAAFFVMGAYSRAGAEERWTMPKLMPFSSQSARPVTAPKKKTSTAPSFVRHASAILPDVKGITRRLPKLDSPLDRLGDSAGKLHRKTARAFSSGAKKVGSDTKAFLSKSKEVLSPWPASPKESSRRYLTGAGSSGDNGAGGSLMTLPKWWNSDKQQPKGQPPQTMSDWLKQPRLEY
jgi:hypothetical protein